jgi:beige protein homolog 1
MSSSNPDHIINGVKILARLLVTQGPTYVSKFAVRVHGFPVLRHNLTAWWELPILWPALLAVLFGADVVSLKAFPGDQRLKLFDLVDLVKGGEEESLVVFPEVFPIIAAILKAGFDSTLRKTKNGSVVDTDSTLSPDATVRPSSSGGSVKSIDPDRGAGLLQVVIQFLLDMHSSSASFRDFASSTQVIEHLIGILFPIVCSADPVNAETELMSKDSILTFDTGEIRIESLSLHQESTPVLRPVSALSIRSVDSEERPSLDQPMRPRASSLRRASSYVLIASDAVKQANSKLPAINPSVGTKTMRNTVLSLNMSNSTIGSLLELVTAILVDNVLGKREFTSFDFVTRLPPSFQEHQIYFVTYLLRNTLSHLNNTIALNRMVLCQSSKILSNIARFSQKCADAIFEGIYLLMESYIRLVFKRRITIVGFCWRRYRIP